MQEMQIQSLGWEDSLEEGNPFWYFPWENPMDSGVWWARVHGVRKGQTGQKWLRMQARSDEDRISQLFSF